MMTVRCSTVRLVSVLSLALILVILPLAGCDNGDEPEPPIGPDGTVPVEEVTITIGNMTDLTGPAANGMYPINLSLNDMVGYYNENNLIPGVKLKVVTYDEQWDPSRDIPGYEWLKNKGADLIWTSVVPSVASLKSVVDRDEFPLFAASATMDVLMPPGYAFSLGTIPQYDAYTLLKWIAENDWDYKAKGPAKIGAAAWYDGYSDVAIKAMKKYAEAHPDQFDFVGGYLTDFSFIWGTEIEALKDCDYIWPPVPMHVFVKDYRAAGYDAKFIGSDPHAAFMGLIDTGELWDEIDGMLFIRASRYWTEEEGTIIDLTRELVYENHAGEAEDIIRSGVGYLATSQSYQLCNIIRNAAAEVGPENLDSEAVYNAALNYTENIDGFDRYSFDAEKRCSTNYYIVYEVDGQLKNLYRADPEWLPLIMEP